MRLAIAVVLIMFMHGAHGQSIEESSFKKEYSFGKVTSDSPKLKELLLKSKDMKNLCVISITFAKFTIEANGAIGHISFTNGSSPVINNFLRELIMCTNNMWNPRKIDGVAVKSKPFILPLIYLMESNCKYDSLEGHNFLLTALNKMLEFDDEGKLSQLDCIILQPYVIGSNREITGIKK